MAVLTSRVVDYVIEGTLTDDSKLGLRKEQLAVHAFVDNKEVGRARVDKEGHYKLVFKYEDELPNTELRVMPAYFRSAAQLPLLCEVLSPDAYRRDDNFASVKRDVYLAPPKEYKIHGQVMGTSRDPIDTPQPVPVPATLEFYWLVPNPLSPPGKQHHFYAKFGSAWSDPPQGYEFDFRAVPSNQHPTVMKIRCICEGGVIEREVNWNWAPDLDEGFVFYGLP